MQRRKLLASMGAAIAMGQLPALATEESHAGDPPTHLNLQRAQAIAAEMLAQRQLPDHEIYTDDLDLGAYTSASLAALEHLTFLRTEAAVLGFDVVTPRMAEIIGRWFVEDLEFTRLSELCENAAKHLWAAGGIFHRPIRMSTSALAALVANFGTLSLTVDDLSDLAVAKALAEHQGDLHLWPTGSLSLPAVAVLNRHAGYQLTLYMPKEPSERLLAQLASNPSKRLHVLSPDDRARYAGLIGVPNQDWEVCLRAL